MKGIELYPEAEQEMEEATRYYAERNPVAAKFFVEAFEAAIRAILEFPNAWPRLHDNVRRRSIDGFPYWVIYEATETTVEVISISHSSRRPGYWKERVKNDS